MLASTYLIRDKLQRHLHDAFVAAAKSGAVLVVPNITALEYDTPSVRESSVQEPGEAFKFAELFPLRDKIDEFRPLKQYVARDGTPLSFRHYPAATNTHLILVHGSSAHSAYLHAFAEYLSVKNIASVYSPDLRGHGLSPARRGDIDYIGQLEDDLADLISHIRKGMPDSARIIQ